MSLRRIDNIQTVDLLEESSARCFMIADGDVDGDGPNGNPDHDPTWQPETSLKHNGHSIDSYKVPGIVVPPSAEHRVKGIVLGCKARVTNRDNGAVVDAVVYDTGPIKKVGEVSVELAKRLGLPHNPNTGGTSDFNQLVYEWWPGIPAVVDGETYELQPS